MTLLRTYILIYSNRRKCWFRSLIAIRMSNSNLNDYSLIIVEKQDINVINSMYLDFDVNCTRIEASIIEIDKIYFEVTNRSNMTHNRRSLSSQIASRYCTS